MDEAGKTRVGVRDLRGNLSFYLHQARQGMSFLVMSHGEAVAELRPPEPTERPRRQPVRRRAPNRLDADFTNMPPDILAATSGEEMTAKDR